MSMLNNIKALVNQKTSFMETSELLLGDSTMMESMDESIILTPYMEAEKEEDMEPVEDSDPEAETGEPEEAETPEGEASGEEDDITAEDPMAGSVEDEPSGGEGDDLFNKEIPDDLGFDGVGDPGAEEETGEEPLPLPGDDLPEPIGAQTGEPINTDDAVMSLELGMGSDTPRDILPIPPAHAADAIEGDGGPMLQGVDSGFGGNSMSSVGPMDGAAGGGVMDMEMDDAEDPMGAPAGEEPSAEDPVASAGSPEEDLSLESVEQKIKNDVEHEEKHKAAVAEEHRKSAKANKQFGENYVYDIFGQPISESSEELVFDPFTEAKGEKKDSGKGKAASKIKWSYKQPIKSNKGFNEIEADRGTIPDELKTFIRKHNSARPSEMMVFMVGKTERVFGSVLSFNKEDEKKKDVDSVFVCLGSVSDKNMLPFAIDPAGNLICYNLKKGTIHFWNHEVDSLTKVATDLETFINGLKVSEGDEEKDVKKESYVYDFDREHYDPFNEAIEMGGGDQQQQNQDQNNGQQQPQDPVAAGGAENEVTAAVKDKVDEASGGTDAGGSDGGDDAAGGLDFGSDLGGDPGGGVDLGGSSGGMNPEASGKMMQMLSKLQTDIAKMQSELAQGLTGQ